MKTGAKKSSQPFINFLGLDTETVNGYCRLLCLSDGRSFKIQNFSDVVDFLKMFSHEKKIQFFAWNADYDIQALLKYFPKKYLDLLIKGIDIYIEHEGFKFSIRYIKGKYLEFDGNYIFDALQYYGCGLKEAAEKYLPEESGKGDFDASKINENNIYSEEVEAYCLQDALLVAKLFSRFYAALPENLKLTRPISNAFYAYAYFRKELSENRPKKSINDYFRNGYHGGRFEIFEKGFFRNLYVYDINSAYPYEIAKLRSLQRAHYLNLAGYVSDAAYSIYKVKVKIKDKFVSPLLSVEKGLCCYPTGDFEGYITKGEYERIVDLNPEIIEGFHVFAGRELPFKEKISDLYHRRKTSGFSLPFKVILNSLYGKNAQAIPKWVKSGDLGEDKAISDFVDTDGVTYVKYEDISKSNFVYASEITARTRLRLYDCLEKYPDKVVMVQTDSVISKGPLELPLSNSLGDWKLEKWDEAILIGSGVYFYRKGKNWYGKFRGWNPKKDRAYAILSKIFRAKKTKIAFNTLKRFSIQEARRIHDEELGNQILEVSKDLNINFDKKRLWLGDWKSGSEIRKKRIKSLALYRTFEKS